MIFPVILLAQATLGPDQMAKIDTALSFAGLTPQDLCYNKDWANRDSFRLDRIDRCLRDPLALPVVADSARDSLLAAGTSLSRACALGFRVLDVEVKRGSVKKPEDWQQALKNLDQHWKKAEKHRQQAFAALSRDQVDTLLYYAMSLWAQEDTQSTRLKGALLRQFGADQDTTWCDDSARLLEISEMIDWQELGLGAVEFAAGVDQMVSFLQEHTPEPGVYRAGEFSVLVGDTGNTLYSKEKLDSFCLIVEPGGNDVYQSRTAGAVGFLERGLSCVIDMRGDDVYRSTEDVALGSGVMAYAALVDMAGDDVYQGLNHSCGTGLWGAGFLLDMAGNDVYDSRGFFAQGSGQFGTGVLLDMGGNDDYRAFCCAQAFSSTKGSGLLLDKAGNDTYYAGGKFLHKPLLPHNYRAFAQGFSIGNRPVASGGFSLLLDASGNDVYSAEVFSQGCSYWYSMGLLYDMSGDDSYNAVQYAQGSGIHLSAALLVDASGDDRYFSRYGPSQGEGHDLSVGFLIDRAGNDNYQVSGGLGVGLTNSVGIFYDASGDDNYSFTEAVGLGHANRARRSGGVGLFIDAGGEDVYPEDSPGGNGRAWLSGFWGVGWDTGW